ncbi:ribonucleoside triphosphate reductase [Hippea jasoniae]|uniref:ribonucleoside triphosphate reductase n=1 Tax=Hippea jasoniae TaxID=944479 RepID=UPI000551DF7B|nr:ribonucleoside triphosphate reductase [Hippea jasoniae]
MFDKIIKRDGRIVDFDAGKITAAIAKAGKATGEFGKEIAEKLTLKVLSLASDYFKQTPTVEGIQDIVEEVLLNSPFKKTAKAYILYREQHAQLRELKNKADINLVDKYLNKADWEVKENSNMSFSLQGLNNYISSSVSKTYWLNKIYPSSIKEAHLNGDFHIHDLGILGPYCVGWDLKDLLISGFRGAEGKVESLPAKHFRTALGHIVNFFYTLQGEAAGAQAFSNFDTLLAPFVATDNLSYKEVKQCIQEFLFNMNIPTRVGFQTPYTNITLDLKIPEFMKNEAVIIGGKLINHTYGEFEKEAKMINRAFFEVAMEGDARGRPFTFPIPTINITKDFDWDNPQYEPIWKATAKYGLSYFANFINSDMKPEDTRSMCCRLRLDLRELKKRGGGLFGANPLTGSIGVVTINMTRIGYLSQTENEFFERLENLMELAKESLQIKRKVIENLTDGGLYPYSKFYLRDIKQRFAFYWKNHFSTIGLVGMNEALLNFKPIKNNIASSEGKTFALKVLNFMRKKLIEFQTETQDNYNLEATPAEGTSYRLAMIDKRKFGDIITAGNLQKPYYTNSTQLPVNYTDDVFEALQLQDELQCSYTGGTVLHMFLGEQIRSTESLKKLLRTTFENFRLPYISITPTFSVCPQCGYLSGEHSICPNCKQPCEVYSRIVGYLRPINQWNDGKQQEFFERKVFKVADNENRRTAKTIAH